MEELALSPAAPALFLSLMEIKILEGKDLDWLLPIANSADDIHGYEAMIYGITNFMCPS